MASPEFYISKVDRIFKAVAKFLGLNLKAVIYCEARMRQSNEQFRKITGSSSKNKLKISASE